MLDFTFESPLIVEETFKDYVMVEATLLTEGKSKKGHLYTIGDTDFSLVAETAVNKLVYYGTDWAGRHDAPKLKGEYIKGEHGEYSGKPPVGKVIKAWFDRGLRKVKAKLKIWDSSLINNIRKGFKVSIRGIFNKFKNVIYRGKQALKIFGLKIKDIQLVPPEAQVGVKGAEVERVLEETMSFALPFATWELDVAAVIGKLIDEGEL